jgi:hypothetical protein
VTHDTPQAADGSAPLGEAAEQALRLAGYNLSDAEQRGLGLLAYRAAVLVQHCALAAAHGRRAGRVGRNEPCPCGSGKKYKKCCLEEGKPAAARSLETAPAGEPLAPALVPRLHDAAQTGSDLRQLGALLERDPDLRALRLPGANVARFLAVADQDGPELEGEALDRFVDQVAQRYVQTEPEGATLVGRPTSSGRWRSGRSTRRWSRIARSPRRSVQTRSCAPSFGSR